MRTLSATLTAAQKDPSRLPVVKLEAHNNIGAVQRLEFTRLYEAGTADSYHGAAIASDGSLNRARLSGGTLHTQRVPNPSPESDFAAWTDRGIAASKPIAVCASAGAEVSVFYLVSTPGSEAIRRMLSSDDGKTWPVTNELVVDLAGMGIDATCTGLAAAYNSLGDVAVFLVRGTNTHIGHATMLSGAAWSGYTRTTFIAGCTTKNIGACGPQSGTDLFPLAVAGTDTDGNELLWGTTFSLSGGTYTTAVELDKSPSGGDYSFTKPYLAAPDQVRLFYAEKFSGTTAYERIFRCHSVKDSAWSAGLITEPDPFNDTCTEGLAAAFDDDYLWLERPGGVWRAPRSVASVDLAADVLRIREDVKENAGSLVVELRNDDGRYASSELGSGDKAALTLGCELRLGLGYYSASGGTEYSWASYYQLQAVEHVSGPGWATVILRADGHWERLDRWAARHQFRWNAGLSGSTNLQDIIKAVCARAGIPVSVLSSSTPFTGYYPDFTIYPGQDGAQVLKALLSYVPDLLRPKLEAFEVLNPLAADASTYAYGSAHAILEGRYLDQAAAVNYARAEGRDTGTLDPIVEDEFDWTPIQRLGARVKHVHDWNLTAAADAEDRAEAYIREAAIQQSAGELVVPPNCGQELYDVIDITDSRAGLSAAKRRVRGLAFRHDRGKGVHQMRLELEGV